MVHICRVHKCSVSGFTAAEGVEGLSNPERFILTYAIRITTMDSSTRYTRIEPVADKLDRFHGQSLRFPELDISSLRAGLHPLKVLTAGAPRVDPNKTAILLCYQTRSLDSTLCQLVTS